MSDAHPHSPPPQAPLIELRGLAKTYEAGGTQIYALRPTDLIVRHGAFLTVMGPSGSGKSTLLNLFGLLMRPTAGTYLLEGREVSRLNDDATSAVRCKMIGMVFQSFNLLSHLTILENVCVPMQYAGIPRSVMRKRAKELLDRFGLGGRYHSRPTQLSGGQCQRVAIARALANDPPVILADEPTGNLDEKTGLEVLGIFQELHRSGKTIIMVTHNPAYRVYATQAVTIHDGRASEA
ncbi:MAG TPA: ABC transporter ATP-binding protein [Kiritimatiellia bacterium]|nr:ABC transporter ATP-binding protein [Kiritimatiellia bacterium]HRU69456.1 ABC transporter ATP-binding protein [Kiritimatiellia bacterium]